MLQDTETEILKPHYIHVYKVFGYKFWLVYILLKGKVSQDYVEMD